MILQGWRKFINLVCDLLSRHFNIENRKQPISNKNTCKPVLLPILTNLSSWFNRRQRGLYLKITKVQLISITIVNAAYLFEEPFIAPKFMHNVLTVKPAVVRGNR